MLWALTSGVVLLGIYIAFPLSGATWSVFLLERIIDDVTLTYYLPSPRILLQEDAD